MSVLAVIPARYASTRFPGKPLADLCGKPLVVHTCERAREAKRVDEVVVATDDARIARAVEANGFRAVMTSPDCPSGTDRIAEVVAGRPDASIIVNVQGDEPLIAPEVIDRAVEALESDPACAVSTAVIRIARREDFESPHVVKAVLDLSGRALYFSRSSVPNLTRASAEDLALFAPEEASASVPAFLGFKHFGLYVYRREALLQIVKLPPSPLERVEKLEQLRFLEHGFQIRAIETALDSIGVDTPEDLEAARVVLEKRLAPGV
ncbi:MAG TPA: 3-deoxy-manno-octulosonate cytidylyltransferase [Candidatus Sumerlaeota bacterium]|nr:3-deoxy-manno-octulosonate cytidylyltransferase [Candidatus Sumerlaeota bacterium]HPS02526.1 3-deoxy-manno-octulosonate cytidylyltransferase [Candidatus Sumerlaeota bacterium]